MRLKSATTSYRNEVLLPLIYGSLWKLRSPLDVTAPRVKGDRQDNFYLIKDGLFSISIVHKRLFQMCRRVSCARMTAPNASVQDMCTYSFPARYFRKQQQQQQRQSSRAPTRRERIFKLIRSHYYLSLPARRVNIRCCSLSPVPSLYGPLSLSLLLCRR